MIKFEHQGNFNKTENFFNKVLKTNYRNILDIYGKQGVNALKSATPTDSGNTADSWGYKIRINRNSLSITWTNSNINDGIPIAILIQYGHGTRHGGYVQGRDYINPALRPIFDKLSNVIWQEVTNL